MSKPGSRIGFGILLGALMISGVVASYWAGNELDRTARAEWTNKFRIDAARLTDGVLFWISKAKVNLRALSSQMNALKIDGQGEFQNLIDEAASWDPDVTFDGVAFAQRVMRKERPEFESVHGRPMTVVSRPDQPAPNVFESYGVTMSSSGDSVLRRMNDLSTHPSLRTAVVTAFRLPGHVVLGPTYETSDDHRSVLIATATEIRGAKGVLVAELGITEFFNVFSADSLPKGIKIRLIERDSEGRAESVYVPIIGTMKPGADVVGTEVIRLVSGQARWDLNWDVTNEYLDGPSDFSAILVQIGGSLLSILLFGTIGFLTFQNIRFNIEVAERTAELSRNSMIVQLTMDSIDQGFAVWNSDKRLVVWSRRCYDFWLEPPKEVLRVGMHIRQLLEHLTLAGAFGENPPEDIVEREMERITAAGESSEDQFTTPSGIHVHVRRFPLEKGGYVAVYTDITEQEEAIQGLNLANKDLEVQRRKADDASRAKSDFLATMSHEIRTPMTSVMGFADMLLEGGLQSNDQAKVFQIKESTQALLRIINDILDISKLEAGKMEIENIDFHLPALLRDIVTMFESGSKAGIGYELSLEDGFPEAVRSDPTRIRQILVNLIGNAKKFTKRGKVAICGSLDKEANGNLGIRIEVRDTGIGMTQDTISKLFSDFTQADASISRQYEGTGLGLAICRRLVELMDGEIGVKSEFGEGSTFWIRLPFVPATSPVQSGAGGTQRGEVSIRAERPLRLLVAEDNEINQMIVTQLLRSIGHDFEVVTNGRDAVKAHEDDKFDLILMDVRMPEMSGLDATRMIRGLAGEKSAIPIVALTADAMSENKSSYLEAGMNGVATKPINRVELMTAINEALGEEVHVFEEKQVYEKPVLIAEPIPTGENPEVEAAVASFLQNIDDFPERD